MVRGIKILKYEANWFLGSIIQRNREIKDVNDRIKARLMKYKMTLGVLYYMIKDASNIKSKMLLNNCYVIWRDVRQLRQSIPAGC